MQPPRRRSTTRLGIFFFACGVLGAALVSLQLVRLLGQAANVGRPDAIFMAARVLALGTSLGLIAGGVALLRHWRFASAIFVVLVLLTSIDSLATFAWFLPPVPTGLSAAGRAGRHIGRTAGLVFPPIAYVLTILYLASSRTRAEFARSPDAPR